MGTFVLTHLTSRLSVGSWPPKLPRSAFESHWPPLEVRYLGYIRIASSDGVYPLTCAKADGGSVSCVSAINAAIAGAWLLPSAPSLSHSPPSRRLPTLTLAAPSKDPKKTSHHHLPLTLNRHIRVIYMLPTISHLVQRPQSTPLAPHM